MSEQAIQLLRASLDAGITGILFLLAISMIIFSALGFMALRFFISIFHQLVKLQENTVEEQKSYRVEVVKLYGILQLMAARVDEYNTGLGQLKISQGELAGVINSKVASL